MESLIFIGSSMRALKHAKALKEHIEKELAAKGMSIQCRLWRDEGMFELSKATIENLIEIADEIQRKKGYAILLLAQSQILCDG